MLRGRRYAATSTVEIHVYQKQVPDCVVELSEDDLNYRVVAELPGLKKENINVCIDGNCVVIGTDAKSNRDDCSLVRRLELERAIDLQRAYARYRDGRLELMLPKQSMGQGRRLIVN